MSDFLEKLVLNLLKNETSLYTKCSTRVIVSLLCVFKRQLSNTIDFISAVFLLKITLKIFFMFLISCLGFI